MLSSYPQYDTINAFYYVKLTKINKPLFIGHGGFEDFYLDGNEIMVINSYIFYFMNTDYKYATVHQKLAIEKAKKLLMLK
jgi:hypothetical protein